MKFFFITLLATITLISCDGGLEPEKSVPDTRTGFGGTVTFVGEWDPEVTETIIVLFNDPLLSEEDFNILNLKYLSTPILFGTNEFVYNTIDSVSFGSVEAGSYAYLAVAQTKADPITLNREDWYVVGVYQSAESGAEPGEISIEEKKFKSNVNIKCDFNNPPPQPPGGK